MTKWDRRFIGIAQLVATWSKDPSTGVGAVIVDNHKRVVSMGFNGLPQRVLDNYDDMDRDEKLRRTIHAEDNALLFARGSVAEYTIYVTHPPCARCAAKIIQAGIGRVVSRPPWNSFAERWADDMKSAATMFVEAGVQFDYVDVAS